MRATVFGVGPVGLAAAACLGREGIEARILEEAADVGPPWRSHYGLLHLHTARGRSGLPGLATPAHYGR